MHPPLEYGDALYTLALPSDEAIARLLEWHKHRLYFCLWYVQIDDDAILRVCTHLRHQFGRYLSPNYQRQFHITVFVGGFWVADKRYDDDFDKTDLNRQIHSLNDLNLKSFELRLGGLHSFDNCLVLKIGCDDELNIIKKALQSTHQEISPAPYVPHITLGFYKEVFLKQTILEDIGGYDAGALSFRVRGLTFGFYRATQLQGKLTAIHYLDLG